MRGSLYPVNTVSLVLMLRAPMPRLHSHWHAYPPGDTASWANLTFQIWCEGPLRDALRPWPSYSDLVRNGTVHATFHDEPVAQDFILKRKWQVPMLA